MMTSPAELLRGRALHEQLLADDFDQRSGKHREEADRAMKSASICRERSAEFLAAAQKLGAARLPKIGDMMRDINSGTCFQVTGFVLRETPYLIGRIAVDDDPQDYPLARTEFVE